MSWLKIDDNAPTHKKILRVSPAARWLWICGLAYCQRHRTDGLIPAEALSTFGLTERGKPMNTAALGDSLIRAGLWHADADGYLVHDFLDWNESAADREEKTSEKTERQRKWRHGKRRGVDASTLQNVDASPRVAVDAAPTPTPTPTPREERATPASRYGGDAMNQRVDRNSVALIIPREGQIISVPSQWWDRVKREHGLVESDVDAFAKWSGPVVAAEGLNDGGKRFAWLDAMLARWLQARKVAAEGRGMDARAEAWIKETRELRAKVLAERAAEAAS